LLCAELITGLLLKKRSSKMFSLKGNPCPELVEGRTTCMTMLKYFASIFAEACT
jgi:hypothetical protein